VLSVCAVLVATGCVNRQFIIESNVPNAQVYVDNQSVGPAPAHVAFEYYGYYNITLVQPGYETVNQRVHVTSPWYGYPPIDFFAEVVWPFHIRDTRRYFFNLEEMVKPRVDDLLNNADSLRQRGYNLPIPAQPAPPKPAPATPVPSQPIPLEPTPGIIPGPVTGPVVPPGGALPQPGASVPTPSPIPNSTIPSVAPGR
jgi:hypothetical protein